MFRAMKNKTPLQELIASIYSLEATSYLLPIYEWLNVNKERLISAEREMVAKAYSAGQEFEWGTDPNDTSKDLEPCCESGYVYFDTRYGTKL